MADREVVPADEKLHAIDTEFHAELAAAVLKAAERRAALQVAALRADVTAQQQQVDARLNQQAEQQDALEQETEQLAEAQKQQQEQIAQLQQQQQEQIAQLQQQAAQATAAAQAAAAAAASAQQVLQHVKRSTYGDGEDSEDPTYHPEAGDDLEGEACQPRQRAGRCVRRRTNARPAASTAASPAAAAAAAAAWRAPAGPRQAAAAAPAPAAAAAAAAAGAAVPGIVGAGVPAGAPAPGGRVPINNKTFTYYRGGDMLLFPEQMTLQEMKDIMNHPAVQAMRADSDKLPLSKLPLDNLCYPRYLHQSVQRGIPNRTQACTRAELKEAIAWKVQQEGRVQPEGQPGL